MLWYLAKSNGSREVPCQVKEGPNLDIHNRYRFPYVQIISLPLGIYFGKDTTLNDFRNLLVT